jgi:hypothetical protein
MAGLVQTGSRATRRVTLRGDTGNWLRARCWTAWRPAAPAALRAPAEAAEAALAVGGVGDIRAMHLALTEPVQVMFEIGVFAGLKDRRDPGAGGERHRPRPAGASPSPQGPALALPHAPQGPPGGAEGLQALPVKLTWYQGTRHTLASHWVMDGRPIVKLQQVFGALLGDRDRAVRPPEPRDVRPGRFCRAGG